MSVKPEEAKKQLVIKIMQATGFIFLVAGIYGFLNPRAIENLIGLDPTGSVIFSSALVTVGIIDLLIMPKIINKHLK